MSISGFGSKNGVKMEEWNCIKHQLCGQDVEANQIWHHKNLKTKPEWYFTYSPERLDWGYPLEFYRVVW